jgi:hypothetical protein
MSLPRLFVCVCFSLLMTAQSSSSCEWDYQIWIPRSATADPLYRFTNGRKAGYIDQTGKIVVPPVVPFWGSNGDGEFHNGLLEIAVADGVYVDASGKKAIEKKFYRGWDFSEGLAVAMEKDGGKWGYINTKGEFAITPRFVWSPMDYVWPFEGGFAKIEVAGKFGYIDHSGDLAIQARFLDGDSFHDEMARVVVEGPCAYAQILEESPCPDFEVLPKGAKTQQPLPACKYTFIDKSGSIISEQRYDYALPFAEALAPVRIGKLWGYIDKKGLMVVAPRFDSASSFSDGLGLVSENGLFGYVDRKGTYIIRPEFKRAESFAEGRAVVGDTDSGYWYIDHNGTQAISGKFALASPFFKGLAHVKVRSSAAGNENITTETFAYIDRDGRIVFKYTPK